MKRYSALVGFGLALLLTSGAALKWGGDTAVADNAGATIRHDGTVTADGGLKLGEYACYGSGGSILIGLGFKVLSGNRYTDLDGKEHGTFSISSDNVTFRGGHLDGQVGTNLKDYKFNIHSASCEPFKQRLVTFQKSRHAFIKQQLHTASAAILWTARGRRELACVRPCEIGRETHQSSRHSPGAQKDGQLVRAFP